MSEPSIPDASDYHMSSDEFRLLGHQLIDFIADYRDTIGDDPVLSQRVPGETAAMFSPTPPEHGDGLAGLAEDLKSMIVPGLTHWQSPNFFAYFPANASYPSVLGELLSAGFGVQGMLWATSPAATEVETVMMDWLVDLCGLPARFHSSGVGGGVMLDSASSAVLTSMIAARHRAVGHRPAPELRAYTSTQAHSSVLKGMRAAGFADDQLRSIEVDDTFAMRADLLEAAVAKDLADGYVPFFVVATVGTTSSTAIDPIAEIAAITQGANAWLHVDAAYAGSAAVAPELRPIVNDGLDQVDSYSFNPHKWLLTNFDAAAYWVSDSAVLTNAMAIVPEYLKNAASDSGKVIDYRDWQIPLGRRFRALKLWLVIRWYGAEGLRAYIRDHVAIAQELAQWVDDHPSFERLAPNPFSLVCFAHVDGDDRTREIVEAINATGTHYVTHTSLAGRYTLRVAIGSVSTERSHVEQLWADIVALA
jgi:aromatic-L-amino-acid decarboxylase